MKAPTSFRLGFVGHGLWPSVYLIPGAQRVDGVDVVALCGRDRSRAAAVADSLGVGNSYDSVERMLHQEDLDGLVIATPPRHHESAAAVVAAHDDRVAIMCEKPVALDLSAALRIRDALQTRPALTGFTLRWQPLFQVLDSVYAEGVVGRTRHVRINYLQSASATPAQEWSWHHDAEEEPLGVVSDLGPHAIDLVRWLIGEVTRVSASARTTIPVRLHRDSGTQRPVTNIDDADVLLETNHGASASLTISRVQSGRSPGSVSVEILAEKGWIRADSAAGDEVLVGTAEGTVGHRVDPRDFLDCAGQQIGDFADLARGNPRTALPTLEDGVHAQAVVDAIGRSLTSGGGFVDVAPLPPVGAAAGQESGRG